MQEINPQVIIDEMSKRIHSLTLENIILSSQVAQLKADLEKATESANSAE